MDKLLEVNDLTKRYSQGSVLARIVLTAADSVTFYIKPAEIFTLAGESGCASRISTRAAGLTVHRSIFLNEWNPWPVGTSDQPNASNTAESSSTCRSRSRATSLSASVTSASFTKL